MGTIRNMYNILGGKPDGKRLPRISRRRRKNNIKVDLLEILWESVNWIHVAQDRGMWWSFVKTAMNVFGSIKQEFYGFLKKGLQTLSLFLWL